MLVAPNGYLPELTGPSEPLGVDESEGSEGLNLCRLSPTGSGGRTTICRGGLGSSVALGSLTTRHSSWHREQDGWGLKTVALEFFPESSLSSSRLMS